MSFLGLRRLWRHPDEGRQRGGFDRTWLRLLPAETLLNPRPAPSEPATGVDLTHEAVFRIGETEVRPPTLELVRDGQATTVERKVMQALVVLARRPGEVTSRDELIQQVWSGRFIGEDAIHRVMSKLRQAAASQAGGDFTLETVPRVGYRLAPANGADALSRTASGSKARWLGWSAAAVALLAIVAAAALIGLPTPAKAPPSVRLAGFTALDADVPSALPARLLDDARIAFATDNVVLLRERDPDFVLSGALRRVDSQVRLSVRLDDARDGTLVWSDVREWGADQRVAPRMQVAIVSQIVRCGLTDAHTADGRLPTHTLSLYLQYCAARKVFVPQPDRSLSLARRIVAASPGFGQGWSSLAWSAQQTVALDPGRADAAALRAEAVTAVERALRLDPQDAQAFEVKALLKPDHAWSERERLLKRASDSRLTACGCEVADYAGHLLLAGRAREAVVQYQRAYQREPFGGHALPLSIAYEIVGDTRRSDEAFDHWSELFADQPDFPAYAMRHAASVRRWAEAEQLAPSAAQRSRDALITAFQALASGDTARMAAAAPPLARIAAALPPYAIFANVLADLGDRQGALDVLERAVAVEPYALFDPAIIPLRDEPRYLRLLEGQGLIRYWRESGVPPDMCRERDPPRFCRSLG